MTKAAPLAALLCAAAAAGAQSAAVEVSRSGQGAYEASIAPHGGGFAVAWHDTRHGFPEIYARLLDAIEPGRSHELHFQRFTAGGAPDGGPRRLTDNPTTSLIPAIRGAGSRFALAWNEDVVEAPGDHLGGGRSEVVFTLAP